MNYLIDKKYSDSGMVLTTGRLLLRGWQDSDAAGLFKYAKDDRVGPSAGWLSHTDVGYSRAVIRTILSKKETYAICYKDSPDEPIGSIGLTLGEDTERFLSKEDAELGYWLGVPFWGKGIAHEAAVEVIRHGFADIGLEKIYCCYFEGNERSRRLQEKCGFIPYNINEKTYIPMLKETRKEYRNILTKVRWDEMYHQ